MRMLNLSEGIVQKPASKGRLTERMVSQTVRNHLFLAITLRPFSDQGTMSA